MESQTQYIGKYEIVSTLGRGSMGVVYKARDPEIGRIVAIKTLRSVFLGEDEAGKEALQRFRQESRSAGSLQHPNIVTIYEAGRTSNGSPYIVMGYVDGKSLEVMLKEQGPLDPLGVLHYLAQVASALDYAHALHVVHRDVKPSNVLIDKSYKPFLVDFGVAKISDTSLTPTGTVVGTPSYMSPEQIRGEAVTGAADVFSLAVVAFEVLTGSRPFPGKDFSTVIRNIAHKEPLTFKEVQSKLPIQAQTVLHKGMSKIPSERYPNAFDLIKALADSFSVLVDQNGLIGGYNSAMRLPQFSKEPGKLDASSSEARPVKIHADGGAKAKVSTLKAAPKQVSKEWELQDKKGHGLFGMSRKLVGLLFICAVVGGGAIGYLLLPTNDYFGSTSGEQDKVKKGTDVSPKDSSSSDSSISGEELRKVTAEQLPTLKASQINALLDLDNVPVPVIVAAVTEIGRRGDVAFLDRLTTLSKHPDFNVRVEVIKALKNPAYLSDDKGYYVMVELLYDKEYLVRGFAAKALGALNDAKARQALNERLATEENQIVISVINKVLEQSVTSSSSSAQSAGPNLGGY